MQGIILTGGKGTRLAPLTDTTNKHLLDICGKPMVYYSLSLFLSAGVTDITLITNTNHVDDFKNELDGGFGAQFNPLRFIPQEEKPGIAGSIQMMPPEFRKGPYMVVLGDNLTGASARLYREEFEKDPNRALILISEVLNPNAFGVAHIVDGKIVEIEEKPKKARSRWVITGIYFFPKDVFDIAADVRPSARGEYEVTDILSAYLKQGRLEYRKLTDWWVDAGTHETIALARRLVCGEGIEEEESIKTGEASESD